MQEKKKKEIKSAYDMTDEEVAKSVDLNVSDFSDDGADLDELRDIMEDKWAAHIQYGTRSKLVYIKLQNAMVLEMTDLTRS